MDGVDDEEAERRLHDLNSVAWTVGHLAWQEQLYFLHLCQGQLPLPRIDSAFRSGAPASAARLAEVLPAWRSITAQADPWLEPLTIADLTKPYATASGAPGTRILGDLIQRTTYHYWFHIGQIVVVRKMLGHAPLPRFVGNLDGLASYAPEERSD